MFLCEQITQTRNDIIDPRKLLEYREQSPNGKSPNPLRRTEALSLTTAIR
jgi:hypothetical protein